MKRLDYVPQEVLDMIKTEHEKALDELFQDHRIYRLPMRIANMRVLRDVGDNDKIEPVILPPTLVSVPKKNFLPDGMMYSNDIRYIIENTTYPFPLAHIYKDSGYVCLGNIFVPSKISRFNPSQPLETLLLHNDRNLLHGGAYLSISKTAVQNIYGILTNAKIPITSNIKAHLNEYENLIQHDTLWVLSADVLAHATNIIEAYWLMTTIYTYIFPRQEPSKI